MKLKLILAIAIALMTSCRTTQYTVKVPKSVDMPKKVLFLSQSGTQSSLYQTVIDLQNNEMVILQYSSSRLDVVYRTGITVNPNDYKAMKLVGTDAPIKEEQTRTGQDKNPDGTPDLDGNPANNK